MSQPSEQFYEPWNTGGIFNPGTDNESTSVWSSRQNPDHQSGIWVARYVPLAFSRRIVACINACRGIDTDRLEQIAARGHRLNPNAVQFGDFP